MSSLHPFCRAAQWCVAFFPSGVMVSQRANHENHSESLLENTTAQKQTYTQVEVKLQQLPALTIRMRDGLDSPVAINIWIEEQLQHADSFGNRVNFVVEQNQFVPVSSLERDSVSNNLIAMVEGRSTHAQAGSSMHQTAPWIQPGWNGHITP